MTIADVIEAIGALCLIVAATLAGGAAAGWATTGVLFVAKSFELDLRTAQARPRRPRREPAKPENQVRR